MGKNKETDERGNEKETSNERQENRLFSLVITPQETEKVRNLSNNCGVSMAQIVRGFFRSGMESEYERIKKDPSYLIDLIRSGNMQS